MLCVYTYLMYMWLMVVLFYVGMLCTQGYADNQFIRTERTLCLTITITVSILRLLGSQCCSDYV